MDTVVIRLPAKNPNMNISIKIPPRNGEGRTFARPPPKCADCMLLLLQGSLVSLAMCSPHPWPRCAAAITPYS